MENELKIIISHLEEQDEKITQLLNVDSNASKKHDQFMSNYLDESAHMYSKFFELLKKKVLNFKKELEVTNSEISKLNEKLPVKVIHNYKFDRNSRNELLLAVTGILFLISFSIISVNYFRDNTNYKQAWDDLMEVNMSNNDREKLNSILKQNED